MASRQRHTKHVCLSCRGRHLACDSNTPCLPCKRLHIPCVRETNNLRFRHAHSKRYGCAFKKDQIWLGQKSESAIQFVDETAQLKSRYTEAAVEVSNNALNRLDGDVTETHPSAPSPALEQSGNSSRQQRDRIPDGQTPLDSASRVSALLPQHSAADTVEMPHQHSPTCESISEMQSIGTSFMHTDWYLEPILNSTPYDAHHVPSDSASCSFPSLSSEKVDVRKQYFWPDEYRTAQCVCLMRYFVMDIAPYFDICDLARPFSILLLQRARQCPPLLHAIFAASARRLVAGSKHRGAGGVVEYGGIRLPRLTTNSSVEYFHTCIGYLIEMSNHPEQMQDENVLITAVLLRYFELLDTSFDRDATQRFQRIFQAIITSHFSKLDTPTPSDPTLSEPDTPQHAAMSRVSLLSLTVYRMALRLEVTCALFTQRPVDLPLQLWALLQKFDPTDDTAWTYRLLLYLAHVLDFCFRENGGTQTRSCVGRWQELKEFERMWETSKPSSFSAMYHQESDAENGLCFPKIWYMSECHIIGMIYADLAQILLIAYDPTVPRLGAASIQATQRMSATIRDRVRRICGTAESNKHLPSAVILAHLAIALCGQYFSNPDEQSSMIRLLRNLEIEHVWPTARTIADLQRVWSQV